MENKIIVKKGRTIISDTKNSNVSTKILSTNQSILDQMQSNFERNEQGYSHNIQIQNVQNNQANSGTFQNKNGGININNLSSILPLISGIGAKNNMTNILSMLQNNNQNGDSQNNLLSQLLPLISNMNNKNINANKENEKENKKINSLKRVEED